jgi:hypothetical protein
MRTLAWRTGRGVAPACEARPWRALNKDPEFLYCLCLVPLNSEFNIAQLNSSYEQRGTCTAPAVLLAITYRPSSPTLYDAAMGPCVTVAALTVVGIDP